MRSRRSSSWWGDSWASECGVDWCEVRGTKGDLRRSWRRVRASWRCAAYERDWRAGFEVEVEVGGDEEDEVEGRGGSELGSAGRGKWRPLKFMAALVEWAGL